MKRPSESSPPPPELAPLSHTLDDCLQGLIIHRSKEAYAAIGQGLWLLNACAINALPVSRRGQGRKSSVTVALDSEADQNAGFEQWLAENVTGPESPLRLSRRTCYNYMTAARNVGLQSGDGEDELAALQARNALAGLKLTDLYKLESGAEPTPKSAPSPPGGPEQLWLPFTTELSTLFEPESPTRKALYQVPQQELEALETRLRFALDAIREVKASRKGGAGK